MTLHEGAPPVQGAVWAANDQWAQVPPGWEWDEVAGVAADSRDRVFVFNRGPHPLMIFNRDGLFAESWGEGLFTRAHGITIAPDDTVWCVDDLGHTVRKFSPRGELLLTLGSPGCPSDTGATSIDFRTIVHSGPPFHFPTNLALAPDGEVFITDGYGNARVHHFAADGRLLHSWGEPGALPSQFHVPHGIALCPKGRVCVADRENSRLQFFSQDGAFLEEWTDLARPSQVHFDSLGQVWVAELGYRAGMWPGTQAPTPDATGGRVSLFNASGGLLQRWGGGDHPTASGDFFAPHDVTTDSHGDVYVAEVTMSAGGNRGLVSPHCHSLQKFTRSPK